MFFFKVYSTVTMISATVDATALKSSLEVYNGLRLIEQMKTFYLQSTKK